MTKITVKYLKKYLKVHEKRFCKAKHERETIARQQYQQQQYQQHLYQHQQQQYQQQQQCQLQQQCLQQQQLQQNFEVIDVTIQQDTDVQQERPLVDDGVSFSDSFGDFIDDGDIMITQEYHH